MELYLIGGKAKSGKDSVAKFIQEAYQTSLKKVAILHITEPLNELAKNYFGWDGTEETKPRELLQKLGIEIIREKLGEKDLLKRHLVDKIEILSSFFDVIVVSDLRLIEEFTYLKEKYKTAFQILVVRPSFENGLTESEKLHFTEQDLEKEYPYDFIFENETIEKLKEDVYRLVEENESR